MSRKAGARQPAPYLSLVRGNFPGRGQDFGGGEMSSEASSARGLAGLIDVLDRADDGATAGQRPRARRSSSYRPAGSRSGVRTVPLRSVQPAPLARPALNGAARIPAPR